MLEVNITELRNHLKKYLKDAHTGNEILVMRYGKVIARILPPIATKKDSMHQIKSLQNRNRSTTLVVKK